MRKTARDVILVALPTAIGRWLIARTVFRLQQSGKQVELVYVDRHDEVYRKSKQESQKKVTVFASYYPSRALLNYAAEFNINVVVGLTDATASVEDMCAVNQCSFLEALRACSASAALLTEFAGLENKNSVMFLTGAEQASDVDAKLTKAFGFPGGASTLNGTLDDAIFADLGENRQQYAMISALPERNLEIARTSLGPLIRRLGDDRRSTISWPHDVFLSGDRPGSTADRISDITGPARVIYYGPYLHLPNGNWQVRLLIGFSNDIDDMTFSVELLTDEPLVSARLTPEKGGAYKAQFPLRFTQAEKPIEIRIRSEAGAIEGKIVLQSVDFLPM
jgi:hypothetical protein